MTGKPHGLPELNSHVNEFISLAELKRIFADNMRHADASLQTRWGCLPVFVMTQVTAKYVFKNTLPKLIAGIKKLNSGSVRFLGWCRGRNKSQNICTAVRRWVEYTRIDLSE
jgi:hypothetical protein